MLEFVCGLERLSSVFYGTRKRQHKVMQGSEGSVHKALKTSRIVKLTFGHTSFEPF